MLVRTRGKRSWELEDDNGDLQVGSFDQKGLYTLIAKWRRSWLKEVVWGCTLGWEYFFEFVGGV